MKKYWLLIIIATIFEVMWVVELKHSVTGIEWVLTALAIFISFGGLILNLDSISTVGSALIGVVFFGESKNKIRPVLNFSHNCIFGGIKVNKIGTCKNTNIIAVASLY